MMINYIVLMLLLVVPGIQAQDCDSNSDSTQCSSGEICLNDICSPAVPCASGAACGAIPGTVCVSDYCQPPTCTAAGQCINGQVCSEDTTRTCVYPVSLFIETNSPVYLQFPEPGTEGSYEEISWYKDSRDSSYRVALVHPAITGGVPLYYGDFCSGSSPCETSTKGELDVTTGELTIFQVELSDAGNYFYMFYSPGGTTDTGHKFQIQLVVYEDVTCFDSASCDVGEICVNNQCEKVTICDKASDCSGIPGTQCVADYCQPEICTTSDQCVNGQICSHDVERKCVYPVSVATLSSTDVTLSIAEPAAPGTYDEITWYRDSREETIAMYHPDLTNGEVLYFGDFCAEGDDQCETSTKGNLDTQTGDFTVFGVNSTDERYYYYRFYAPSDATLDTGHKYEIQVELCEEIVTVCGSNQQLFEDMDLPKFNPEWSLFEAVEIFEESYKRAQFSPNGMKTIEMLKQWMKRNP